MTDVKGEKCRKLKPDPAVLQAHFSEVSGWTDTGEALQHESWLAATEKQVTGW